MVRGVDEIRLIVRLWLDRGSERGAETGREIVNLGETVGTAIVIVGVGLTPRVGVGVVEIRRDGGGEGIFG